MALYVAVSIAELRDAQHVRQDASTHTITRLFGAIAFAIFYWFAATIGGPEPLDVGASAPRRSRSPPPGSSARSARRSRSWTRRARGRRRAGGPRRPRVAGARAARGTGARRPQVTFVPDNKRVAPKPGQTLLEIAEANGMPIEAGCRMGICGADPVAIKDGMECTSPISDDERATLDRLGFAAEHAHGVLRARHRPGRASR